MNLQRFKIGGKLVGGYQIKLAQANLVLAVTSKGYICCGYLDIATSERLGDVACKVTGIRTIKDLLNAKIVSMTSKAKAQGIKKGMIAKKVLEEFL